MTRQRTRIVVAALVVATLLLMIALTADGDFPLSPRDGRVVSAATATLYGAIIAGTFTLLGVVVERLIQRYGSVRCVIKPIEIYISTGMSEEDRHTVRRLPVPADYLPVPKPPTPSGYGPVVQCSI
jgi:hypothetical protein